jgi:hypothetical protein
MGVAARRAVEATCDIEAIVDRWEEIYRDLCHTTTVTA